MIGLCLQVMKKDEYNCFWCCKEGCCITRRVFQSDLNTPLSLSLCSSSADAYALLHSPPQPWQNERNSPMSTELFLSYLLCSCVGSSQFFLNLPLHISNMM